MALAPMDELDRLFDRVVRALAERGSEDVRESFQVAELYQELVPYRQNRSALRLDTYQDYEMAMLRLLAGERGYATVEPAEAQEALVAEAQATYPETGVVREFAAARVHLNVTAAQHVMAGAEAYAPQTLHPPPSPSLPLDRPRGGVEEAASPGDAEGESEESCPYCNADLPRGRQPFYCPFCGGNLKGVRCPECRTELEVGWLYCITCGRKMGGD